MKKVFMLLSAVSVSALMSACSATPSTTSNCAGHKPDMAQQENWKNEHKEHMQMMVENYFNKMDVNHDGEVSMKEFMDFQRKMFREADTDHDGYLTLDEMMAQKMKEMKKMKKWKHEQGQDVHDQGMNNGDIHAQDRMRDDSMSDIDGQNAQQ